MGNLVKFGEYFYKEDPETIIKRVVSRFSNTGYLSKKNIDDLESVGISKDEFLKIDADLKFLYEVKRLIYSDDTWSLFETLLLDIEMMIDEGSFELSHKGISLRVSSNSHRYRKVPFDNNFFYSLDLSDFLLKILDYRNNSTDVNSFDGIKSFKSRYLKGNPPLRKTKWFSVNISLNLELHFGASCMYKNTQSFGYGPITNIRNKMCNILTNDVMFRFLKINGLDKFDISCRPSVNYETLESFILEIKRSEKSAEQSADFLLKV